MANPTMTLISSQTVGAGGVASVTFSSIPQNYTDLIINISARDSASGGSYMQINGATTNYNEKLLYGAGGSAFSANQATTNIGWCFLLNSSTTTTSTYASSQCYIPNYTSSANKYLCSESLSEDNATNSNIYINSATWANTAAITSLIFTSSAGTFQQYSTFYLYGIKNS